MKLITPEQQAKVRFRLEVSLAAVLATFMVATLVVITDPGYLGTAKELAGLSLQSA